MQETRPSNLTALVNWTRNSHLNITTITGSVLLEEGTLAASLRQWENAPPAQCSSEVALATVRFALWSGRPVLSVVCPRCPQIPESRTPSRSPLQWREGFRQVLHKEYLNTSTRSPLRIVPVWKLWRGQTGSHVRIWAQISMSISPPLRGLNGRRSAPLPAVEHQQTCLLSPSSENHPFALVNVYCECNG